MYVVLDGERLKQLRARKEELSSKIGCSEKTIENAEMGRRVRTRTASEIAQVLGVDYEELLLGREDVPMASGVGTRVGEFVTSMGSAPPVPDTVIGRDGVLRQLKLRLMAPVVGEGIARRVAIHGWPGVGKSTVAAKLAHDTDIWNQFTDGILWVSLGQAPKLLSKLEEWGRGLGTEVIKHATTPAEASALLAALLQSQRRFLVIDDVWDEADAVPFLVGGPLCATLVTTRLAVVAERLAPTPGDSRNLEVLDVEDALRLLEHHAPDVVSQHRDEARTLVEAVERLPLAIAVAGHLLTTCYKRWEGTGQSSVARLLEELKDAARLLEEHAPANMVGMLGETKPTIAALLQKSTDYLDESTRERFAYLGEVAPKPATLDLELMSEIWMVDQLEARRIANTLIDHGLLEPVGDGRFWMHALLVSHAKTLWDEE